MTLKAAGNSGSLRVKESQHFVAQFCILVASHCCIHEVCHVASSSDLSYNT